MGLPRALAGAQMLRSREPLSASKGIDEETDDSRRTPKGPDGPLSATVGLLGA